MYLKKTINLFSLLVLTFPASTFASESCQCDKIITPEKAFYNLDRFDYPDMDVQPGDTICLMEGEYQRGVQLYGFHGTEENPITVKNCGGVARISNQSNHGVILKNAQFMHFTGSGEPGIEHGIVIENTPNSGFAAGNFTTDIEIDHLEIRDVGKVGLHMHTAPSCDPNTWRENFTMQNVHVHHNKLTNIGTEGFYIGNSFINGKHLTCDGEKIVALPHEIHHMSIHDNSLNNLGWDGFQVSMGTVNTTIYNNTVKHYGQLNIGGQRAGIVVGGGTTGAIYNNYVDSGAGGALHIFGREKIEVYNNILRNAALRNVGEAALFIADKTFRPGESYHILNNTIINSGSYGIHTKSNVTASNLIANNLIVNTERRAIYYETNTDNTLITHNAVFADTQEAALGILPALGIEVLPTAGSPVIDAGDSTFTSGVSFDFAGNHRNIGAAVDVGAIEFTPPEPVVLYRVNAGGSFIDDEPVGWESDEKFAPSQYVNAQAAGDRANGSRYRYADDGEVPVALFNRYRWDPVTNHDQDMEWNFAVEAGLTYEVTLYFSEDNVRFNVPGLRVFDVHINNQVVAENLDIVTRGFKTPVVISHTVRPTEDNIHINFYRGAGNPKINAIQIKRL